MRVHIFAKVFFILYKGETKKNVKKLKKVLFLFVY